MHRGTGMGILLRSYLDFCVTGDEEVTNERDGWRRELDLGRRPDFAQVTFEILECLSMPEAREWNALCRFRKLRGRPLTRLRKTTSYVRRQHLENYGSDLTNRTPRNTVHEFIALICKGNCHICASNPTESTRSHHGINQHAT